MSIWTSRGRAHVYTCNTVPSSEGASSFLLELALELGLIIYALTVVHTARQLST